MSRCFPYPPPGYVRNPVAVAEAGTTAKLQKERETAEKKKEKRGNRKALQHGEMSKHSKHSHKKRKHENISTVGQQPKMLFKESVEHSKSELSEEHGAPCFIQTVHSPESSQDSSKRRKVVLPSTNQAKNGNILRFKIKRDQNSPRGVLEKPIVPEQRSFKQMGLGSSQLMKPNSMQQHNKVNVKSAAAAHERINVKPQAQKQASTQLPSKFMRRDDPQMAKVVQQVDSSLSVKPTVGRADLRPPIVLPHSKMVQRDLPGHVAPAERIQSVHPQVPCAEIQRKTPPDCPKALQKARSHAIHQLENLQPPLVQNSKLKAPGVYQIQRPSSFVSKEEPSTSGRNVDAVQEQEARQSKSDRKKSRKAEKKEKKIEDLFVTWNPPSFEMEESDVGVQDWLFGSTRNSDVCKTNCRASDGSVPFQTMEQQHSLQPTATFVSGLHLYQLPYVVPF